MARLSPNRPAATELVADQRHHRLAALVERGVEDLDDAAVGLGRRRARLQHRGRYPQRVARPHRRLPADFVEAWRAETARRQHTDLEEQLEREADRLQPAGDEAAVDGGPGRL